MTPDQARFVFEFLLPQLESEHATTRKILSSVPHELSSVPHELSSVPHEKESYRPDPKSKSALELARHIAVVEIWFLDAVINRRFGDADQLPAPVSTCHEIAQWYAENFTYRMPILNELSNDDLAARVNFIDLRKDPAVAYLNIAIRHSVHHRGQLSAYLRPMGARVPAIYVESADEPFPGNDGSTLAAEQPPPAF